MISDKCKAKKKNDDMIPEYDYLKASSAQDCTGLIPSLPIDEGEMENYEELYPFLPGVVTPNQI